MKCPTCGSEKKAVRKLVQLPDDEYCPNVQWDKCTDPWHSAELVVGKVMPRLDDVGTRMEHLMDLHNIWSFGLSLLEKPGWFYTALENDHALLLRAALKMLEYRLEEEYSPTPYAKTINSLPKDAKDIV